MIDNVTRMFELFWHPVCSQAQTGGPDGVNHRAGDGGPEVGAA